MDTNKERKETDYILDRVNRLWDHNARYRELAGNWQRAWMLDPGFERTLSDAINMGQEQVVTPLPFSVVNMSQRLLESTPVINYIPSGKKQQDDKNAEQVERFLMHMWDAINTQQGRNVISDITWYVLVRGRFAVEVKWAKSSLPKLRRERLFPISVRPLDPCNVCVYEGPYGPEYAFHKYQATLLDVIKMDKDLRKAGVKTELERLIKSYRDDKNKGDEHTVLDVVDYYTIDEDGAIHNAILVQDEFAKPMMKTDYPDIPFVCGYGDYGLNMGGEYGGLSILHPLIELWQYQCRLASQMATGLMRHFWPPTVFSSEHGEITEDLVVGPGKTTYLPPGVRLENVGQEPNVPLAQGVQGMIDAMVQQVGYPEVLYGKAPGELQAGYGVSILSDAAKGRIKNFLNSLEMGMSQINGMILALIEEFGGDEGVSIWVADDDRRKSYNLAISKKEIKGNYYNKVNLKPNIPSEKIQLQTLGMRLADAKYISAQTLRDEFLGIDTPTDEAQRITLEEAMQSDELRPFRIRLALQEYFGHDNMLDMLYETQLMPPAREGYHWMRNEKGKIVLMSDAAMQRQQQGQLPPPGGPPVPPGQLPSLPPGMLGPGMSEPGPGMPPQGPPPIQPPAFTGPMGGGIPPELQGQITPEMMGDPMMNPAMFGDMMGAPLPPEEELTALSGGPPPMY